MAGDLFSLPSCLFGRGGGKNSASTRKTRLSRRLWWVLHLALVIIRVFVFLLYSQSGDATLSHFEARDSIAQRGAARVRDSFLDVAKQSRNSVDGQAQREDRRLEIHARGVFWLFVSCHLRPFHPVPFETKTLLASLVGR